MPGANRHFLPGHVWHITHRCHQKKFEVRARSTALFALGIRSQKRFGLSVLDYMVTCNHVHLLIKDTGPNVIARSMQLVAGRTGQEYNERKGRHGAFWEDRYHATAISRIYGAHEPVIEELRWLRGLGFGNRLGQKVEHAL